MPNPNRNTVSRSALLDVAADIAWRFKAYNSYGGDPATAIRAIRRKCTGFSARQLENALSTSLELYDFVHELVRDNASSLWDASKSDGDAWANSFDDVLRENFPAYRISTLRKMVGMDFYYWHMR